MFLHLYKFTINTNKHKEKFSLLVVSGRSSRKMSYGIGVVLT